MRAIAAMLACTLLCSCADFSRFHPESRPLAIQKPSPKFAIDTKWWTIFKDDQLDALIEEALANSPDIRIAQARIRLARSEAGVTGADRYPQLNADGSAVRERISATGYFPPPLGGSTLNFGQLSLDFDYEFDWWGKNRAALNAALSETSAEEAEAIETRLILGAAIAQSYFMLQSNLAKLDISKHILQGQESLLRLARFRASNGIESDYRVSQEESNVAKTRLDVSRIEEAAKLGRNQIAALLGKPQESGNAIKPRVDPPPQIPASIPADLIGMRPDIMAQRYRIEAATSRVAEAKAEFYPNIDLAASVGVQSIGFGNLLKSGSEIASFGPAIHLPIFGGGRLRANLGAQYAEYDIAVEGYNRMVIDAMRDVSQASTSLQSIIAQISAQNELMKGLEKAHEIALSRYREGLGDALSVLEAETPLLSQRNIKTDLDEMRMEAILQMIKSLGGAPMPGGSTSSNPG
ncbi:MAG: efflux transporter outer membrane subunit [Burkholderiales bacterium]